MIEDLFTGLFDTYAITTISPLLFVGCLICGLLCGGFLMGCYRYRSYCSQSLAIALILLPVVVAVVIMSVNGNIGSSVAIAGAFALVRFRSIQASAKEITVIFIAMAIGLLIGMGYLVYALLTTIVFSIVILLLNQLHLNYQTTDCYQLLQLTVPEDLNDEQAFEEVLRVYASSYQLIQVKTTNMGSLFRLTYQIKLKQAKTEAALINQLRCRNGNLEISIYQQDTTITEL